MALHDAVWEPGSAPRRLEILDEALGDRRHAPGIPMLAWQARFGRFVALLESRRSAGLRGAGSGPTVGRRPRRPSSPWVGASRRAVIALLTGRLPDARR
jgi:hypothetical protein